MARDEHIPLADGGHLHLVHGWLSGPEAHALFNALRDELPWRQETFKMGGWQVTQPRLTCWHGDPNARYTYSRRTFEPSPWTPALSTLRDRLNAEGPVTFNSVLGNLYRDGKDSMGCHADNEPELGADPVIASLSLGGTRRLSFHHNEKSAPRVSLDLEDGCLLWMTGSTQRFWRHSLPKTARKVPPRINLTFRKIIALDEISTEADDS